MDDSAKKIFNSSSLIIGKLQLLSVFFEEELVFKIYIRTQVIHRIFENNPELDIHKLDLFHIQFTESIIELLRKIKKNNEKTIMSVRDEMEVNEDLIRKLTMAMREEGNFDHEKEVQAATVSRSIFNLYQNLSDYSKDNPFPKNITEFGSRSAQDHFFKVNEALFIEVLDYDPDSVYKNGYGTIGKKLLGLQCRHEFKNEFICGLKSEGLLAEVYKLNIPEDAYFIFFPAKKIFLDFDFSQLAGTDLSGTVSQKTKIIQDLAENNLELGARIETVKKSIPDEVRALLTDYYNKISGIDFLDLIDDYDIQANILKTMLNTDRM